MIAVEVEIKWGYQRPGHVTCTAVRACDGKEVQWSQPGAYVSDHQRLNVPDTLRMQLSQPLKAPRLGQAYFKKLPVGAAVPASAAATE